MKHGSLFSGIGGFDLAAEWMGWENVFHCEIEPFCQKILNYYWPKSISYGDIKTTDFTIHRGRIDVLTGGFPCQPFSQAGKRQGTDDNRYLWPEMLRAIREIQPGYIVGENVRGLTNWNGGLVFDQVQADLENEGYEVLPFLLPACAVNAPHRRDRIWFVAHSSSNGYERGISNCKGNNTRESDSSGIRKRFRSEISTSGKDAAYSNLNGCQRIDSEHEKHPSKRGKYALNDIEPNDAINTKARRLEKWNEKPMGESKQDTNANQRNGISSWQDFPTQSPICNGNDGLSLRLDGITFPKWRNESIKGAGNAIVPELVLQIFKSIEVLTDN